MAHWKLDLSSCLQIKREKSHARFIVKRFVSTMFGLLSRVQVALTPHSMHMSCPLRGDDHQGRLSVPLRVDDPQEIPTESQTVRLEPMYCMQCSAKLQGRWLGHGQGLHGSESGVQYVWNEEARICICVWCNISNSDLRAGNLVLRV